MKQEFIEQNLKTADFADYADFIKKTIFATKIHQL